MLLLVYHVVLSLVYRAVLILVYSVNHVFLPLTTLNLNLFLFSPSNLTPLKDRSVILGKSLCSLYSCILPRRDLPSLSFRKNLNGTQRLLALAGPLFEILKKGRVLVVDELDKSLHTLLVRHLSGRFQLPSDRKNHAQLIFTSHDTSLLSPELLRRDQIWFVEKDKMQSSSLIPLTDFAPRKHEAIERGYLSGRYGAVPILREWAR